MQQSEALRVQQRKELRSLIRCGMAGALLAAPLGFVPFLLIRFSVTVLWVLPVLILLCVVCAALGGAITGAVGAASGTMGGFCVAGITGGLVGAGAVALITYAESRIFWSFALMGVYGGANLGAIAGRIVAPTISTRDRPWIKKLRAWADVPDPTYLPAVRRVTLAVYAFFTIGGVGIACALALRFINGLFQ